MPDDVDPSILTDALLMHVADIGSERGADWLRGEFDRVLDAVMAGDRFTSATAFKGQSASSERSVNAKQLLAVLTQARERLAAQSSGGSNSAPCMLIPRFTGFPLST